MDNPQSSEPLECPSEIYRKIIKHVNSEDIKNLRLCDKKWYSQARNAILADTISANNNDSVRHKKKIAANIRKQFIRIIELGRIPILPKFNIKRLLTKETTLIQLNGYHILKQIWTETYIRLCIQHYAIPGVQHMFDETVCDHLIVTNPPYSDKLEQNIYSSNNLAIIRSWENSLEDSIYISMNDGRLYNQIIGYAKNGTNANRIITIDDCNLVMLTKTGSLREKIIFIDDHKLIRTTKTGSLGKKLISNILISNNTTLSTLLIDDYQSFFDGILFDCFKKMIKYVNKTHNKEIREVFYYYCESLDAINHLFGNFMMHKLLFNLRDIEIFDYLMNNSDMKDENEWYLCLYGAIYRNDTIVINHIMEEYINPLCLTKSADIFQDMESAIHVLFSRSNEMAPGNAHKKILAFITQIKGYKISFEVIVKNTKYYYFNHMKFDAVIDILVSPLDLDSQLFAYIMIIDNIRRHSEGRMGKQAQIKIVLEKYFQLVRKLELNVCDLLARDMAINYKEESDE